MKKRLLFLLLAALATLPIYAYGFEVGGICYETLTNSTCAVTSGSYSGDIVIPESVTYNGTTYRVSAIGDMAFDKCSSLTSVAIPNSVTSIGYGAFYDCSSLTSLTIGRSVTSIGEFAFASCSSLTSLTIPSSVTSIGNYAFNYCRSLNDLVIEDGYNTLSLGYRCYGSDIGKGLFYECGLETIYLGRNLSYDTSRHYGYSPFYGNKTLKAVIIGKSVTSIDYSTFSNCPNLIKAAYPNTLNKSPSDVVISYNPYDAIFEDGWIYSQGKTAIYFAPVSIEGDYVIPESVTTIGNTAFSGCSGLTSVDIPTSVIEIGEFAFYGCSGLKSLTIPNSVNRIGSYAFSGCSRLNSLTIGNSVASIGNYTFYNCTGLTSVTIGNSVTFIGESAFYNCSGITSITIPNSVTEIGESAFKGCSGLKSLTIGRSVTSIGGFAFSNCSGLTEVIFNAENCTSCGSYNYPAFPYNIKSLTIGESVTTMPSYAFEDCTSLTDIIFNAENCTSCGSYNSPGFTSNIKSLTIGENVKTIPSYAFKGCKNLTSLTFPNSVNTIGSSAFEGCSGLTTLVIGNSVSSIGSYAFRGCTGPTSITIPNSVTSIGVSAFKDCTGLTEVIFNAENCSSCGSSNSSAFPPNIKLLKIGECVKTIPSYAFYGCRGLSSLTIPDGVTSIGEAAFSSCSGLTSLSIPNSVTSISNSAFSGCSGLTSLSIPNSLAEIGESTFNGCSRLTSLTIPNSVTTIGSSAFNGCSGLTSLTIPNSVTEIGESAFKGCSSLTSISIPNSVTSIGGYSFGGCSGLTSLTIPSSVTSIGDCAFRNCSGLTSLTIPSSVTSVGGSAFGDCISLAGITIEDGTTILECGAPGEVSIRHSTTLPDWTSTNHSNSSTSQKEYNFSVVAGDELTFNYAVDSESGYDKLIVKINGETVLTESGKKSGSYSKVFSAAEDVTLNLSYTKDGSTSSGADCASVTDIRVSAASPFDNCPVETLYLGRNLSYSIPPFHSNTYLKYITISDYVTSIGGYAFYGCSGLNRITIPNSVTSIGESAFANCSGLTMVTMGDYVEAVGSNAFSGCSSLAKVKTGNANAWARINFETAEANPLCNTSAKLYIGDDSELASSVVIEGAKPVGTYAFAGASFLEQVRVKDGAPVGAGAFANCSNLQRIALNTPSLGSAAFSGCEALETIYSETTAAPEADDDAFTKYDGVNLYVPRKCIAAYEDAPGCWWRFVNLSAKDMNDLDEIFTPSYINNEIAEIIPVAEINLSKTKLTLETGATFQLEAEVLPADATDKRIHWSSANPQIVSISNSGLLTAIAEGSATVTATSADGKVTASCTVAVIAEAPEPIEPGTPLTLYRIHNKHHAGKYLTIDDDKMLIAADLDESNPQQLFRIETVGDKVTLAAQGTYIAEAHHTQEIQNGTSDTEPGLFYIVRNGNEIAFDQEMPNGGTFVGGSRALSVPNIDNAHVTTWATGTAYSWWYLEEVSSITLNDLAYSNGSYFGNITMPFAFGTDAEVYTGQINGNKLDLSEVDHDYVAAGTPVIIKSTSPEVTLSILKDATEELTTLSSDNHLRGNLFAADAPESAHAFCVLPDTRRPAFAANCRAIGRNESYIHSSMTDHNEVLLNINGTVSIDELSVDGNMQVYDLRGIMVGNTIEGLPHGIYIIKTTDKTAKIAI